MPGQDATDFYCWGMLRDFQIDAQRQIFEAWQEPGVYTVAATLPTGAGKTVLFCDTIAKVDRPTCVIAHRQELLAQASLALNRESIKHDVIAPTDVKRQIARIHHDSHGVSHLRNGAPVRVAGVDTLVRREPGKDRWYSDVQLVVQDEAHHVTEGSKWATAQAMFPNARALHVMAHAVRADGKGLGRNASGLVDRLVTGPSGDDLIARGFLTSYRIFCPPNDLDFSDVPIGATGDYSQPKLRASTHKSSHLVSDVVAQYIKRAPGKLGITFAVDIESATELSRKYQAAGVPAAVITGDTPISVRAALMRQFKARQLLQLVSVDCLGEGVDVPAIEVVSLARRTASWQLYCQQIGRALRVMVSDEVAARWNDYSDGARRAHIAASGKPAAIIIDHVGNVGFHSERRGLPTSPQVYSLADADRQARTSTGMPLRICVGCTQPYERVLISCPYCGLGYEPAGRSRPEEVDGDLIELDLGALAALQSEIARVDSPARFPANSDPAVRGAINKHHMQRQQHQARLRNTMSLWNGWRLHCGDTQRVAHKRFFRDFGVDALTAQTLGAREASELDTAICKVLELHGVVSF